MGRWRSEYRRTHRGVQHDQLLATWQANFDERRHLRSVMMSSHFQLGGSGSGGSNGSTDSLSDDGLSPTRLRLRHLALTSPERAPPAASRAVRFEAPSEPAADSAEAVDRRRRQATPPAEPLAAGSTAAKPSGRSHRRSRSPGSPFAGFGQGERGCDMGERRTFNVTAPAAEVHESARVAAERRQAARLQRDAALDAVLRHGRPAPRPAGLWTTEYQRCFCQPVWAQAGEQRRRSRSRHQQPRAEGTAGR